MVKFACASLGSDGIRGFSACSFRFPVLGFRVWFGFIQVFSIKVEGFGVWVP